MRDMLEVQSLMINSNFFGWLLANLSIAILFASLDVVLFVKIFKELNVDIIIKYNSRKLMTGLIIESGISEKLVPEVTTIIDKKDKLKTEEFNQMLFEVG